MRRGTTPTHTFTLPFDTEVIDSVRIVYAQMEKPVVVKETKDVVMNGCEVSVKLTQKDTLAFRADRDVEIQIRVLVDEDALASDPVRIDVKRLLDGGVLA